MKTFSNTEAELKRALLIKRGHFLHNHFLSSFEMNGKQLTNSVAIFNHIRAIFNPFFPRFSFDPPKDLSKPKEFGCFQGHQKETLKTNGCRNDIIAYALCNLSPVVKF